MGLTMIETFEERRCTVQALQLTPETVEELCAWTLGYVLGPDRWVPQEGCWRVSAQRWYPPQSYLRGLEGKRPYVPNGVLVGIRTRQGEAIVTERDWVVQPFGNGGGFTIVSPDRFNDLYSVPRS